MRVHLFEFRTFHHTQPPHGTTYAPCVLLSTLHSTLLCIHKRNKQVKKKEKKEKKDRSRGLFAGSGTSSSSECSSTSDEER